MVLGAIADWNRRDWRAWVGKHHADMVAVPHKDWPEPEPLEGCEAWLRQVQLMLEPWDEQHLEIDDVQPVGAVVVLTFRWVARGRESQIDVDIPMAGNYTITEGKIKRMEFFFDASEALEAAGLATKQRSQADIEDARRNAEALYRSFEAELRSDVNSPAPRPQRLSGRYWAGDVAGERGSRASCIRGLRSRRPGNFSCSVRSGG